MNVCCFRRHRGGGFRSALGVCFLTTVQGAATSIHAATLEVMPDLTASESRLCAPYFIPYRLYGGMAMFEYMGAFSGGANLAEPSVHVGDSVLREALFEISMQHTDVAWPF